MGKKAKYFFEIIRDLFLTLCRSVLCEYYRLSSFLFFSQLMSLVHLYDVGEVAEFICPVSLDLVCDKVAEVREYSFHLVRHVFVLLATHTKPVEGVGVTGALALYRHGRYEGVEHETARIHPQL